MVGSPGNARVVAANPEDRLILAKELKIFTGGRPVPFGKRLPIIHLLCLKVERTVRLDNPIASLVSQDERLLY